MFRFDGSKCLGVLPWTLGVLTWTLGVLTWTLGVLTWTQRVPTWTHIRSFRTQKLSNGQFLLFMFVRALKLRRAAGARAPGQHKNDVLKCHFKT